MTTTLVLGGVRSGKSRYAEGLLADRTDVTYVAAGGPGDPDDADWQARVAAHRARRPASWRTVETLDLAAAILGADGPLLIDCLGTWLAGVVDAAGWDDLDAAASALARATDDLLTAWRRCPADLVAVTNEVGLGIVPDTASGRFFRDHLGRLNATVAAETDRVVLVVAGRVLDLTGTPVVGQG